MEMSGRFVARESVNVREQQSGAVPLGWIIALLACSTLVVAVIMGWAGLKIDFLKLSNAAYLLFLLMLAAVCLGLRNQPLPWQRRVCDFSEYIGLFIFVSLLGATASYPAGAATSGYVDATLARMDSLLYFDWMSWYRLVAAYPVLQWLGSLAYANIYLSPVLLLGSFALAGRRDKAQLFLVSFWLAAAITLLLFLAFPAVGPLSYLWKGPVPYMPTSGVYQAEYLPLLRDNLFGEVDLGALQGLVCAPSFHTSAAVIYIIMAWQDRHLRLPLLFLNAAMLLSTPVEGTHYLVDMIGGVAVALLALGLVVALQRKIPAWREKNWSSRAI